MQNEEIFELYLNILIEYYKISGHVMLMWNIVLCLNKYLFTNLYKFALKIFLISRLFILLFFFFINQECVGKSAQSKLCNAA